MTEELGLGSEPDAGARVRRFVAAALAGEPDEVVDEARLILTELVTNAQLHGVPPITVRASRDGGRVRLEVEDRGRPTLVLPGRSTEAMTGRGLALVAALATGWGVEPATQSGEPGSDGKVVWVELSETVSAGGQVATAPDLDALLAAWPEEAGVEQVFTVRLGEVPTDLLLDAKRHIDNVVRELTLARGAAVAASLPFGFASLIETVTQDFAAARTAIKRQAVAAEQAGLAATELVMSLPASAADAGERYLVALDEADRYSRAARLLTLESPPLHRVFRGWYVQSLVDQLRALAAGQPLPPARPFVQVLADQVASLARQRPGADGPDYAALFAGLPTAYLVMSPDLVILDANEAYERVLARRREDLVGRYVFEAFPPAPGALDEQGRNPLQVSFERARDTGRADQMPLLNYDVADPATGELQQRFWSLISAPVLDGRGRTVLLLQRVEDVTDFVVERRDREAAHGADWQRQVEAVEAELFTRAQELKAALEAQETSARRLAGLADAALRLAAVQTLEELAETVVAAGLTAMGADGGAIARIDTSRGVLDLVLTGSLGRDAQQQFAELPLDDPLPAAWAARTGEAVLLRDQEAGLRWSPAMAEVYAATGRHAWVSLPLRAGDQLLGSLTASWSHPQAFAPDEVELLSAFAAQCAQALDRLQVRQAEQRAAALSRQMSETLQRSLLTEPPQPEALEVVVRYRPAGEQVQVGGDWYDAFLTRDGATCLVVGDVTGHDREAAAVMGQVRNLLRGIAYTLGEPPAAVLSAVDRAMRDLDVGALATALLARVEPVAARATGGTRRMTWTSAGHPPPLLLRADGSTALLDSEQDLLLGLDADTPRHDQAHALQAGDTVLLYTDGLVERRGAGLDDGLAWLAQAVRERARLSPDALCDSLLAEVADTAEDDIALLVVRTHLPG